MPKYTPPPLKYPRYWSFLIRGQRSETSADSLVISQRRKLPTYLYARGGLSCLSNRDEAGGRFWPAVVTQNVLLVPAQTQLCGLGALAVSRLGRLLLTTSQPLLHV
jgi:hypothetical protein